MRIETTPIAGLLVIEPRRFGDERGVFTETFRADILAEHGFTRVFMQDNCARSEARGVVRGLHFQTGEAAQDKLIRVSRGAIFDVAVDLREGSATFGWSYSVELSTQNWLQLLVPCGFAHGYQTLTPDAEVLYKATAPYAPAAEGGIAWDDPALGIDWPIEAGEATLNARDRAWPTLAQWVADGGSA